MRNGALMNGERHPFQWEQNNLNRAEAMLSSPEIRAVTFDVGGTLIRPWPSVGHIYTKAAADYGHRDIDPEALNCRFADAWAVKKQFDHSRNAWLALVKTTFAGLLSE